jgi:hypothetical protein
MSRFWEELILFRFALHREDTKALTNSVNQFQAITKAQYLELGNRLSLLEKKDISPIINAEASEGVDNMDSDEG